MTEQELLTEVIKLAKKSGALVHHCTDSRHCEGTPGFPDLVIAGRNGVLFAELKTQTGETDAWQDNWIWLLNQAGLYQQVLCYLWRPQDLESGAIKILIGIITG